MARVVLILEDVPGGHVHVSAEWLDDDIDDVTRAEELAAGVFHWLQVRGALVKPEA